MKFIEPKAEIIKGIPPLQKIALIARVCTGTQDKAESTPEDALAFCKKLLNMGHTSPFEHARILLKTEHYYKLLSNTVSSMIYGFESRTDFTPESMHSLNVRDYLMINGELENVAKCEEAGEYLTVCFTIDIGIARELVRHRTMSFMERSTRWCSWSEDNGGIEFIRPENYYETPATQTDYRHAFELAEAFYFGLLKRGVRREFARSVLPLATATKLYVTGTFEHWAALLRLRLGKRAHPAMRRVMKMMLVQPGFPQEIKNGINREDLEA